MSIITGNIYAGLSGGGGGSLTGAQNGASVVSTFVELGGNPLLHTTQIDLANNQLVFTNTDLSGNQFVFSMNGAILDATIVDNGGQFGSTFQMSPTQILLGITDSFVSGITGFAIQGGGIIGIKVKDDTSLFGLFYDLDFSALGHLNPRWLPDIGWIDGNFTHQPSRGIVNNILASGNLVNFATAPGNGMYRVMVTTEIFSGLGTYDTSVSYTDLAGNPEGPLPVDSLTGVGVSNNTKVLNILCQASTHISIDTVLTGVATQASIAFSIELLA